MDKIPECFPTIETIFAHKPIFGALAIVFGGTGECAEGYWTFLGLSIPGWVPVAFICFGIFSVLQITNAKSF